jgi:hypothetical protein
LSIKATPHKLDENQGKSKNRTCNTLLLTAYPGNSKLKNCRLWSKKFNCFAANVVSEYAVAGAPYPAPSPNLPTLSPVRFRMCGWEKSIPLPRILWFPFAQVLHK